MKRFVMLALLGLVTRVGLAQGVIAESSPSRAMAAKIGRAHV